jgi:HlyD family secretion protein
LRAAPADGDVEEAPARQRRRSEDGAASRPIRRRALVASGIVLVAAAAVFLVSRRPAVPPGFAVANGRLEADEVHVATKTPGRVDQMFVDEGDPVHVGQVLARMDTVVLKAQLAQAKARTAAALTHREAAAAGLAQRTSECKLARKELYRAEQLYERKVTSERSIDIERSRSETVQATCAAAEAQLADAEAGIEAAAAEMARIQAELADSVLVAPQSGRIQHRLVEPGEVLGAGGRLFTLIDLDDVYMTVFLPALEAGRVRIGAEARIMLDALPERAFPARVTFVADESQFTPKHVETSSERAKLSFRVKARLLEGNDAVLKPGAPGVVWVHLDPDAAWPESLR